MIFKKIIIILLIIQPLINKLTFKAGVTFDIYNEVLSLMVFLMFIIQIVKRRKLESVFLVFLSIVFYMSSIILIKLSQPIAFLQVVIYSQWFFFFLYFHFLNDRDKELTFFTFKRILDKTLIIIAVLTLVELFYYVEIREFLSVKNHSRGIGGFYLVSFFGSGASLANFCSLYVISWFYYHFGYNIPILRKDKTKIFIGFLILILSFSRKEVLFVVLFLLFFPFEYRSRVLKWIKKSILMIGVFIGIYIYYTAFFGKANKVAFGDNYIRWRIAEKSVEILKDNLPFGTGVGTFGSRVSLIMTDVYQKYNIGEEMLGYKELGQTRGPIYDVFLFTFTTEMGIGILLFVFFFFRLLMSQTLSSNRSKNYIKNFVILYLIGLSVFQPVLISSFGYLCAIFLGLVIGKISIFKYQVRYVKN